VTKRWSSTKSGDGKTKRQASKDERRDLAKQLRQLAKEPPEAVFNNFGDMMRWLNDKRG
jgi:hypothetical protein